MIQIKTASLRAACLVAPTKDPRYYLSGVQIMVRDSGAVHVRATNGTVLFDDCGREKSVLLGAEFVIPLAVAKELAKEKTKALDFALKDDGRWECAGRLITPIEGKFPDCDRVIPQRKDSERQEHYDFELLALCQKAMRLAREQTKGFYRIQNSETAGGVGLMLCQDDEFPRIAISPLRTPMAFEKQ